jgi:sugar phosphate isomerase/epimerase
MLLGNRTSGSAGETLQVAKPDSTWGGVQVGIIAPYAFQGTAGTVEEILKRTIELGLSAVELQADPIELYAGLPPASAQAGRGRGAGRGAGAAGGAASAPMLAGGGQAATTTPAAATATTAASPGRGGRGTTPTPEQIAAQRARGAEVRKWRVSQSLDKYRALRTMYENAGVAIQIVKFNLNDSWTDEEVHYAFESAKALGCRAITCEPPLSQTKRLGLFADKHQMRLGYHGHSNVTSVEAFGRPGSWEQAFFYSTFNGANLDIGHYTAGNSKSPVPFIREHHDRITNLHLKDRGMNEGPNVPWGQGDTPIREVLQLMKREKYTFMATIELEYRVEGSDPMAELKKCVQYCKDALA